jgi:hypothetical protein
MTDLGLDGFEDGLMGDDASLAGFHMVNKKFKLRAKRPESTKEVAMSNTIKGKVTEVKVNPANGRHAYQVDGQWYSTFVNEKTSEEAAQVLAEIQPGYDVEFAFTENKGFFNIDGVLNYAAGEPGEAPKAGYKVGTPDGFKGKKAWSGGAKGSGWKPEDKRPSVVSFAVSYSKDLISKVLDGDDMKATSVEGQMAFINANWEPLADKMLKFMLAKLKDLDYKFPKAE